MKKLLLSAIILSLFSISGFAQISHDLEIFSEDGLHFTLIVNGEKINETPRSSVKIYDTENDYVQALIIFEDKKIPDIKKKFLQIAAPGTEDKRPVSTVYKIAEKKGVYKLKFISRSNKKIQPKIIIIE